jgi:hypothetical protein
VNTLAELFKKIISFMEKERVDYLVIGGIASAALGYPRFTQDVDICILTDRNKITEFLNKLKKEGFNFAEEEVVKRIRETGTFQIPWGSSHVDFLIVSTNFEKSAISRKQRITIYGVEASLPTPEDLILLKVVPSRPIGISSFLSCNFSLLLCGFLQLVFYWQSHKHAAVHVCKRINLTCGCSAHKYNTGMF